MKKDVIQGWYVIVHKFHLDKQKKYKRLSDIMSVDTFIRMVSKKMYQIYENQFFM